MSNNYETMVLLSLLNEFSLQSLFCGKKEFILRSLPKSVAGLEKQFSKSMIYQSIKDFEERYGKGRGYRGCGCDSEERRSRLERANGRDRRAGKSY